ncbi:RxLR-like protein [Plasmopara halstedii]|uniref:carbonic anhydrase n=1 Tax=Plasmopara halstedii TaxID=4781 RepID=A0A0N7L8G1_PLAHL|nr:RxLR-like protein [Plasmopara halstedii]CEG49779.1 RxLR-like protein [Plasmopara halstedii]|eukprot:XP_024586148.1 RxLR-like protein [Plasmopara halstedii]
MTRLQTLALPMLALSQVTSQRVSSALGWNFESPVCKGDHQSPINIFLPNIDNVKVWDTENPPLQFDGDCDESIIKKLENLYKWEIQGDDNCTAKSTDDEKEYSLLQFYLRLTSEHTINNERYDAELQFVHKSMDGSGKQLVIGVLLQAVTVAQPNAFIQNLLTDMENFPADLDKSDVNYAELLNELVKTTHLVNYSGSLTTPECTENVDWWVLLNPFAISLVDLQRMKMLYNMLPQSSNVRPIQPLNDRDIVFYFRQS